MLPRVDRGNQHRVGKRICRALQQRCFGTVMARRLPAFDPGVRVNAGRFTYANVVIQRCAGELIAQRRQQLFLSPIHICERKPDWRLNCQRLLSSSMQNPFRWWSVAGWRGARSVTLRFSARRHCCRADVSGC